MSPRDRHGFLPAICVALGTAFLFFLAAAFSIKVAETLSRLWFVSFAVSSVFFLSLGRLGLAAIFRQMAGYRGARRKIAIIGEGEQRRQIFELIQSLAKQPVEICGVFTSDTKPPETSLRAEEGIAGDLSTLVLDARAGLVDDIVIALPWSEDEQIMAIVAKLRELPINIYLSRDLIGFRTQFSLPPSHFGPIPLFQITGRPVSGWDAVIKAMEDYLIGSLLLILLAPLMLLIAIVVFLDGGRPILFKQKRLGFNNEMFDVYKFRTMVHDSNPSDKTKQATKNDARITQVGRFLRRWSLDELPQLFNVLGGTMSLVGPRPHALDHNDEFAERVGGYFARHRVKPGITGLAQVRGFRGPTDTAEKLEGRVRNDIYYAENWSPSLDIHIMARTVIVCLFGDNAF